jgi:hypothetical protein
MLAGILHMPERGHQWWGLVPLSVCHPMQVPELDIPDGEEASTNYNLTNTKVGPSFKQNQRRG